MIEDWFEKIEDYLNDRMDHEERSLFETELATNKELFALLNIHKSIEDTMLNHAKYDKQESSLRISLEKLNKKYFETESQQEAKNTAENQSNKPDVLNQTDKGALIESVQKPTREKDFGRVRRITMWQSLASAAVLIGFVVLGVIWWYSQKKEAVSGNLNPLSLYTSYFEPDTTASYIPGPLQEVYAYYKNSEYKNAIATIELIDPNVATRGDTEDRELATFYSKYYKALSYMAIDSTTKGISELEKLKTTDRFLQIKAQWYLALAYLKTGDLAKSEIILNQLVINDQADEYKQKAMQLISDLNRNKKE